MTNLEKGKVDQWLLEVDRRKGLISGTQRILRQLNISYDTIMVILFLYIYKT